MAVTMQPEYCLRCSLNNRNQNEPQVDQPQESWSYRNSCPRSERCLERVECVDSSKQALFDEAAAVSDFLNEGCQNDSGEPER